MGLLTKNQQEIGSNLLMKLFMVLLTKKSTRKRVYFINEDIYGSVDTKSTRNRVEFIYKDIYWSVDKKINKKWGLFH